MTNEAGLPPGVSRRQFLEDLLDALGDADAFELNDGSVITRLDLMNALAKEMSP
ncbi:hypothetical protein LQ327_09170 [Actinomycetospora endophytica]|uniref:Uncharacterized protein n=1 Tax=Actinomycetospora endophytica TaxID=2291215 RepID=A0ABS8P5M0_9PSEU|nr:hypothetical protein [Actinomycetospora endophytica]MCD2193553.1 hypothetical protein [Actinomycetospora endophytica]